ncbi:MAG: hypothetical protein Q8O30_03175, partial [Candidatus Omnitrophota bacterium]|nr:hypothetical protein [Candidatus Omnitrophota bacterium]
MTNLLGNRTKNNIYIILPIAIAVYLIYPLLAGYYFYPVAEYSLYKSFMVNFIDSLRRGVLPTWNEYVGCGHPAMYFGHYPISQNTIIYMLFGFSDFTYYLTRCLNLIILLFTFIYACKFLRLSYWIALLGALTYFSINFVSRILIAETIGNLIVVYPLLMILVIKIIQGYKMKDILLFGLAYIFWLSGGHIIYVYMHFIMLSIFFWIAVFVFHGTKACRFKEIIKFIWLYVVLFILPFLATFYQYYFVYDVIAASNRLKAGLIVSPFNALVWKQLLVSFKSSSYFWAGVLLIIIYAIFKLVTLKYKFLKIMKLRFYVIAILSLMIFILLSFPERNLSLLRLFGINYNIKASDCKENYVLVKDSKENIIKINDISTNTSAWITHLATLSKSDDSSVKSCFKITTLQDATGYVYYTVATKPGETYKISVLYKKGTAANGQIKVGTTIDDTSLYYSGVLSDNDWKEYSASFRPTTANTYITLVNLTSKKGEDAYFGDIALYKFDEKPNILSDYIPILKSLVFRISLFVFFLINLAILYKKRKNSNITLSSILSVFIIFIIYVSLLSYYFFSPANIIGDVNGYDFDLFRELSIIYQIIFVFCVLYSMKEYHSNKVVKLTIFSLGALYLLRSHLTIPLLRFTGIVWYATRDGSIFSFFFAVLFMFGLKLVLYDFSEFFK